MTDVVVVRAKHRNEAIWQAREQVRDQGRRPEVRRVECYSRHPDRRSLTVWAVTLEVER